MRVLLTRAADDAARTRDRLEALGHEVVAAPVIEIAPTAADWPDDGVDAVVATSAHAFALMPAGWGPAPEARRLMPLFLVGSRTLEAARAQAFDGPAHVAPQASSLTVGIMERRRCRIVYLAGRDRKPDIERSLETAGVSFRAIETYEARAREAFDADARAILSGGDPIEAVLHFSRRSAALYVALMKKAGLSMKPARHFCLSDDVAVPLREQSCEVIVAANPSETALIEALTSYA